MNHELWSRMTFGVEFIDEKRQREVVRTNARELCPDLIDEWQPSGPTEIDAVLSFADLMWRKRRVFSSMKRNCRLSTSCCRSWAEVLEIACRR